MRRVWPNTACPPSLLIKPFLSVSLCSFHSPLCVGAVRSKCQLLGGSVSDQWVGGCYLLASTKLDQLVCTWVFGESYMKEAQMEAAPCLCPSVQLSLPGSRACKQGSSSCIP